MGATREIRFENAVPPGEKGHSEGGEQALEGLLRGTDAEGYAGDRILLGLALAWLAERAGGRAPTVAEAYRERSADRVEALLLAAGERPVAIAGLPGAWTRGLMHAVEVTRADYLAFRTSPSWRRADALGWILFDPGDPLPVERAAGREGLALAQERSLERAAGLLEQVLVSARLSGPREADVAAALKATSLPRSVRERAALGLPARATLGAVAASLAGVSAACDREEGETYARAAGRLLRSVPAALFGERPPP